MFGESTDKPTRLSVGGGGGRGVHETTFAAVLSLWQQFCEKLTLKHLKNADSLCDFVTDCCTGLST